MRYQLKLFYDIDLDDNIVQLGQYELSPVHVRQDRKTLLKIMQVFCYDKCMYK